MQTASKTYYGIAKYESALNQQYSQETKKNKQFNKNPKEIESSVFESELEHIKQELQRKKQQNAEMYKKIYRLDYLYKDLLNNIKTQDRSGEQKEIKELKRIIEVLKEQNSKLNSTIEQFKREVKYTKIKEIQAQIIQLREQNKKLVKLIEYYNEKELIGKDNIKNVDSIQRKIGRQQTHISILKQKISTLETQLRHSKDIINLLNTKIRSLELLKDKQDQQNTHKSQLRIYRNSERVNNTHSFTQIKKLPKLFNKMTKTGSKQTSLNGDSKFQRTKNEIIQLLNYRMHTQRYTQVQLGQFLDSLNSKVISAPELINILSEEPFLLTGNYLVYFLSHILKIQNVDKHIQIEEFRNKLKDFIPSENTLQLDQEEALYEQISAKIKQEYQYLYNVLQSPKSKQHITETLRLVEFDEQEIEIIIGEISMLTESLDQIDGRVILQIFSDSPKV